MVRRNRHAVARGSPLRPDLDYHYSTSSADGSRDAPSHVVSLRTQTGGTTAGKYVEYAFWSGVSTTPSTGYGPQSARRELLDRSAPAAARLMPGPAARPRHNLAFRSAMIRGDGEGTDAADATAMKSLTPGHVRLLSVLVAAVAASTLAAACGSSSGTGSGGDGGSSSSEGSSSSGGDPCAGLGCASGPGTLVVQVVDAADAPVAAPSFTEKGQTLQAYCETDGGQILADASTCGGWHLDTLSIGPQVITVAAPGYEPQTLSVTIQGPAGCCGRGPEVDETVTLVAPHGDAGNAGDTGGAGG